MVGSCLKNTLFLFLGAMAAISISSPLCAQESNSLLGFWKQDKESVYIHITETDGVISAEMVRNDWSPGLVGEFVFKNLTPGKKNKWQGDALIIGSEDLGTVSVSIKGGEQLITKVRPGRTKKIKWSRTEPMEKRY